MKALLFTTYILFTAQGALALPDHCQASPSLAEVQRRQKSMGFQMSQMTQWHKVESENGVAILIHGLNMKPEKMEDVIETFNSSNFSVLNVALDGHGGDFEHFKKVNKERWLINFKNAYCIAVNLSAKNSLPLYLFGYSTGATVALAAETRDSKFKFDRRIFIAPALKMTWLARAVQILFPFESLSLPSTNKNDYKAQNATPINAYKSLFGLAEEVNNKGTDTLKSTKTLVIMDPKDELVSYEDTQKLKQQIGLDNWSVFTVFTASDYSKVRAPHHAIIHEFFTGPKLWSELSNRIKTFIKSDR